MKSLAHHSHRLLQRMLQAELAPSHEEALRILHKAEKHQRKINKLRRLLSPFINAFKKD